MKPPELRITAAVQGLRRVDEKYGTRMSLLLNTAVLSKPPYHFASSLYRQQRAVDEIESGSKSFIHVVKTPNLFAFFIIRFTFRKTF